MELGSLFILEGVEAGCGGAKELGCRAPARAGEVGFLVESGISSVQFWQVPVREKVWLEPWI